VTRKDRSRSAEGVTHHHLFCNRLVHVEPGGNLTVVSCLPLVIDMIIPELPHPFIRAAAGNDASCSVISRISIPRGIGANNTNASPTCGNPLPTETVGCLERVDRGKGNARCGRKAGIPICIGISSGSLKGNSALTRNKEK
jgi:hypothetical protein